MEKANVPLRQRGDRYADFVCCANHRRMASVSTVRQLGQIFLSSAKIPLFSSYVQTSNFAQKSTFGVWAWPGPVVPGFFPVNLAIHLPTYLQDVSSVFMRL